VGEIRDRETVEIALQAALTGHLVLATLHTNDAASAMTRLLDMGVEPYLIASSVVAVLAQRLVRRTCGSCRGTGCTACRRTGFHGRSGVHELVVVDDVLRARIMARADAATLRRDARAAGTIPLRDDGLAKARTGLTSEAEVVRVTQEAD
jgi:general secretion pathway protein E